MENPKNEIVSFLKSLFQNCTQGFIEFRFLHKDKNEVKREWIPLNEIESIPDRLIRYVGSYNCYFGVATRERGRGKKEDVIQFPCLWVDLDIDKFSTEEKERIQQLYKDFSLKPSFCIATGGGVHIYWVLREPATKEDIPQIENLLDRLVSYFHGDRASTDAGRVLRIPGTRNYKYSPVRYVGVKSSHPELQYSLDDFDSILPQIEGSISASGEPTDRTEDLKKVMACDFLRHCDADRATLSEPEWLAMISNLSRFPGCRDLIHSLSEGYPKYNFKETEEKILHVINGSRPITCETIRTYFDCKKDCGVKSPAALAYRKPKDDLPETIEGKGKREHHFNIIQARDIVDNPDPETEWIWEGILPAGGLSLVVAKPKVGKTTLALNLAIAISRGQPFLGKKTQQGAVVYLALEEKKKEIEKSLAKRRITDEPLSFHFGPAPREAIKEVDPLIRETGAKFLVIDILQKFCRVKDLNDYSQVTNALEPILATARQLNCHIQLLHHAGKRDRDDGDDILGSTGLLGGVDTSVHIKKRDKTRRTFFTIQRYGEDISETVLTLQADGSLEAAGSREDVETRETVPLILEVLEEGPLTVDKIWERVERQHGLVSKALKILVEGGQVNKTGTGKKGNPFVYEKNSLFPSPVYMGEGGKELFSEDNKGESKGNFLPHDFRENEQVGEGMGKAFWGDSETDFDPLKGEI